MMSRYWNVTVPSGVIRHSKWTVVADDQYGTPAHSTAKSSAVERLCTTRGGGWRGSCQPVVDCSLHCVISVAAGSAAIECTVDAGASPEDAAAAAWVKIAPVHPDNVVRGALGRQRPGVPDVELRLGRAEREVAVTVHLQGPAQSVAQCTAGTCSGGQGAALGCCGAQPGQGQGQGRGGVDALPVETAVQAGHAPAPPSRPETASRKT